MFQVDISLTPFSCRPNSTKMCCHFLMSYHFASRYYYEGLVKILTHLFPMLNCIERNRCMRLVDSLVGVFRRNLLKNWAFLAKLVNGKIICTVPFKSPLAGRFRRTFSPEVSLFGSFTGRFNVTSYTVNN